MGAVVALDTLLDARNGLARAGNTGTRLPPAHRSSRIGPRLRLVAGLGSWPSPRSPASRRWRRGTIPCCYRPRSDSPGRSSACCCRTHVSGACPGWRTPGSHCHACTSWRQHNARPCGPPINPALGSACPPCCAGRHACGRLAAHAGGGESRQVHGICLPGCQTPIIHLLQRFGSTRCRPACARAQVPWQDGTRSSHRLRPPAIDVAMRWACILLRIRDRCRPAPASRAGCAAGAGHQSAQRRVVRGGSSCPGTGPTTRYARVRPLSY